MRRNIIDIFGKKPIISAKVFIDPSSRIMGDVKIGRDSAVFYGTIIRGDDAPISIGVEVAILENCIIEAPANSPVEIGDYTLISHGAIIHGAKIGNNVLIGIGAIILDNAVIGSNSIVAAGSLVPPGKEYGEYSLIMGVPAKRIRDVKKNELQKLDEERRRVLDKSKYYSEIFGVND